jgi:hypothetical protein
MTRKAGAVENRIRLPSQPSVRTAPAIGQSQHTSATATSASQWCQRRDASMARTAAATAGKTTKPATV